MVVKAKAKASTKAKKKTNVKPATRWPFPTPGIAKPRKVAKKASPAKAKTRTATKVKPASSWPFPVPKAGKPKKVVKKASPAKAKSIPKDRKIHVVKATLSNVELAKAKSALSLDLYANDKKIGNLEVGQGSFFWTGARRQKSKPIGWSKFAEMMNDLAYKD